MIPGIYSFLIEYVISGLFNPLIVSSKLSVKLVQTIRKEMIAERKIFSTYPKCSFNLYRSLGKFCRRLTSDVFSNFSQKNKI